MGQWLRLQVWKWNEGLFWFQSAPPRMEFSTFFVEGKKGEGKTRYLTGWACRQMRRGIRVCANYSITDRLTGRRSVPVSGWLDVLRLSVDALRRGVPTLFVIDEFHLWADSRSWQKTPEWFRGWLAQSRHYGVGICGSVQSFKTVELRARQITDELRRIRRVHLWRVPLFRTEVVAPESVDAEGEYALSDPHFGLFKWYAGYSTSELIQVEEWRSDDYIDAEVAALTAEAAALVAPVPLSSFAEYVAARAADEVAARDVTDFDGPAAWDDQETLALP